MALIEKLPTEILCLIADMCTFGVRPEIGKYPSSYAKYHSHLTRTSRYFHSILNPTLYKRNINQDPPLDSCMLWAAQQGQLETMKIAYGFGASLDINGARDEADFGRSFSEIPGRLRFFATPLHLSIQNAHRHVVDWLLQNGASVHVQSRQFCVERRSQGKWTGCSDLPYALHTALFHQSDFKDAAAMLIKQGAYLTHEGTPALPFVLENKQVDLVELLLELHEPATTAAALRYAASEGDDALFYRMLQRFELNAAKPDEEGNTALHFVAMKHNVAFAESLLERPEVHADITNSRAITPLHLAACGTDDGSREPSTLVDLFLRCPEVNAGAVDGKGMTPLHYAAQSAQFGIVKCLFAQPEVNAGTRTFAGETPLHFAAKSGLLDFIDLFLSRADVDPTISDVNGRTALHYVAGASTAQDTDLIPALQKFIDLGIDVNMAATDGTSLFHAVQHGNFDAALFLLENGADPLIMQEDAFQWTILHHALHSSGSSQIKLVTKLLSYSVDVDTTTIADQHGRDPHDTESCGTPLFFAAVYAKNLECMRLLLEAGADADSIVMYTGWNAGDDLYQGDEQSFLSAFFRHELKTIYIRDDEVEKVEERVNLLLQFGAMLDEYGSGRSPLEWGCEAAIQANSFTLLNLLLSKSSQENISLEYLKTRTEEYDEDSDDDERVKKVVHMLTEFKERVFSNEDPGSSDSSEEESKGSQDETSEPDV